MTSTNQPLGPKMENTLLTLNVNGHTEKKNGLTYLSWAWAWAEVLKHDPAATFDVQMFGDKCYMEINGTAMVWVTVTIDGKPMTCQLPVMDNTNKPITIEGVITFNKWNKEVTTKLDSFNVNTAIMRCMTKAVSLHGLGLYIYAGEDLPEDVTHEPVHTPALPGVTKEATARVEKIIEKAIVETAAGNPDANAHLFRDSIVEYLKLSNTKADLSDYWKKNQATLDALKVSHPDIFKQIRDSFSEVKAKMKD